MIKKLLDAIKEKYPLTEKTNVKKLKVGGMKFDITSFDAEGLGHVSVMTGKFPLGIMKMDTVMVNPSDVELPLYSYDRIYALGNDTLIVEMYDTFSCDSFSMPDVKKEYSDVPERDPGEHWYDSIKLKESISKKGKKLNTPRIDELAQRHFEEYLGAAKPTLDKEAKAKKTSDYVEGLLSNGGPSTDSFIKALGREKTAEIFREVLFGTK